MKGHKGLFPFLHGNLVLSGYDTEHDVELARKALERLMLILADTPFEAINRELEPYRRINAAGVDREREREARHGHTYEA